MGSWHGTDGITQLAVKRGNPVRMMLISKKKESELDFGGGVCYTNDLYEQFGLPIRGRYDDYGCIDSIKMDVSASFLESYFQTLHKSGKIKIGEDGFESEDYERVTPEKPSLRQFLKTIERGEFKIEGKKLQFVLVLDKVYDRLMASANLMNRHNFSSENDSSFRAEKEENVKTYLDLMQEEHETMKTAKTKGGKYEDNIFGKVWSAADKVWMCEYANHLLRLDFQDYMQELLERDHEKEFKEAQKLIVDYFVFKEFMNRTRKLLTPQCGGGSQDDSIHLQEEIAKVTLEICKSRKRERN